MAPLSPPALAPDSTSTWTELYPARRNSSEYTSSLGSLQASAAFPSAAFPSAAFPSAAFPSSRARRMTSISASAPPIHTARLTPPLMATASRSWAISSSDLWTGLSTSLLTEHGSDR